MDALKKIPIYTAEAIFIILAGAAALAWYGKAPPLPSQTLNDVPIFYNSSYEFPQGRLLKNDDTVIIEGVLRRSRISGSDEKYIEIAELPYNAICFSDPIDAEEGSIIKAKVNILKAEEGKCSDSKLLEFSVVYGREEIKNILAKFSQFCQLMENDINGKKLTKYAVKTDCDFDYRWIPSQSAALAYLDFKSSSSGGSICFERSEALADLLIDPAKGELKEIHVFPQETRICQ